MSIWHIRRDQPRRPTTWVIVETDRGRTVSEHASRPDAVLALRRLVRTRQDDEKSEKA